MCSEFYWTVISHEYDLICDYDVAHFCDAMIDMMADESYHLPSEANQICLSIAKGVLEKLQSPSQGCSLLWLAGQPA